MVCSRSLSLTAEDTLDPERLKEYTQLVLPGENLLEGALKWGCRIPCRDTVYCPDISTLMVRLEMGEGFALLTKVVEGHDSPNLRYWDVPFPEAHAEIVCACREVEREEIRSILQAIRHNNPIRL